MRNQGGQLYGGLQRKVYLREPELPEDPTALYPELLEGAPEDMFAETDQVTEAPVNPERESIEERIRGYYEQRQDAKRRLAERKQLKNELGPNADLPPKKKLPADHLRTPENFAKNELLKPRAGVATSAAKTAIQSTGKQVASTAATMAARQGAATAATVASGAATAGIGAAIGATLQVLHAAMHSEKMRKFFIYSSLALIATGALIVLIGYFAISQLLGIGPKQSGGSLAQAATDQNAQITGTSRNKGQSVSDFLDNVDTLITQLTRIVNNTDFPIKDRDKAKTLLTQLQGLRTELAPKAYGKEEVTSEVLGRYDTIAQQLRAINDPNRQALANEVLAAKAAGKVSFPYKACAVETDIKKLALSSDIMRVIVAAANSGNGPIKVTCAVTGHRKYVGRSPADGYPRCGEADNAKSARLTNKSLHCSGRAIDIQGNIQGLASYFSTRKKEFNLRLVLLESRPPHLHMETNP